MINISKNLLRVTYMKWNHGSGYRVIVMGFKISLLEKSPKCEGERSQLCHLLDLFL